MATTPPGETPGGPTTWSHWHRPDPRERGRVAEDQDRLCGQLAQLEKGRDRQLRRHLFDLLDARRREGSGLERIGLVEEPGGTDVVIAWGELLVREKDSQQPRAQKVLRRFGLDPAPVDCLQGRVVRWANPGLSPRQLDRVARMLRARGIAASVNHIQPLAPIGKGLGGPEPTEVRKDVTPEAGLLADRQAAVAVAVIDTGITSQTRTDGWLTPVVRTADNVDPLDAIPAGGDGFLDYGAGHGTFAAGVVAQMAPAADVRAYLSLDSDGVGSEVDVACRLVGAVEAGADIVNLSLGCQTLDDLPPVALSVALEIIGEHERTTGRDVLLVAAAGNYGDARPCWPAAFRRVVAVAGLTRRLRPTRWSSRGFWVDCSTVGEGVVSTYVEGEESPELDIQPDRYGTDPWALWSGTSFAAPQVAGALAARRMETGRPLRAVLDELLAAGRPLPGFGRSVRLMDGT
jgi:hypothetical protein